MKTQEIQTLFAPLVQALSKQEYQGYTIQLTTDPWALKYGAVWEFSDGESIWGHKTMAECVDAIDEREKLGEWTVDFQWRHFHEGNRKFWYSEAIEFAKMFGKEVKTDWVNRKIFVK